MAPCIAGLTGGTRAPQEDSLGGGARALWARGFSAAAYGCRCFVASLEQQRPQGRQARVTAGWGAPAAALPASPSPASAGRLASSAPRLRSCGCGWLQLPVDVGRERAGNFHAGCECGARTAVGLLGTRGLKPIAASSAQRSGCRPRRPRRCGLTPRPRPRPAVPHPARPSAPSQEASGRTWPNSARGQVGLLRDGGCRAGGAPRRTQAPRAMGSFGALAAPRTRAEPEAGGSGGPRGGPRKASGGATVR